MPKLTMSTEQLIAGYLRSVERLVTLLEVAERRTRLPEFSVVEPALSAELPLALAHTLKTWEAIDWSQGGPIDASRACGVTWCHAVLTRIRQRWQFRVEFDDAGDVRSVFSSTEDVEPTELDALRAALRFADTAGPPIQPGEAAEILGCDPVFEERDQRINELVEGAGNQKWGVILEQINRECERNRWPKIVDKSSLRPILNRYRTRHKLSLLPSRNAKLSKSTAGKTGPKKGRSH